MADFLVHRLIRVCRHRLKGSIEGWPLVLCLLLLTPVPANVGEPNRTCSGPSNIRTYFCMHTTLVMKKKTTFSCRVSPVKVHGEDD